MRIKYELLKDFNDKNNVKLNLKKKQKEKTKHKVLQNTKM